MAHGKVKWVNTTKGAGLFSNDDGSKDVFAHYSAATPDGFRPLAVGDKVEFDIESSSDGPVIENVRKA
jgi:CspA family cold shock protein